LTVYRWVLIVHSAWRWIVIVAGVALLAVAIEGLMKRRPWQPAGAHLSRLFGIAIDIQVLLGAMLYLTLSPLTNGALSNAVIDVPHSDVSFFAVNHGLLMLLALVAVHLSAVLIRRARSDPARQRRAMVCYGLTLLIVLAGIPWWRPLLRW
jgi:hypothetical protein